MKIKEKLSFTSSRGRATFEGSPTSGSNYKRYTTTKKKRLSSKKKRQKSTYSLKSEELFLNEEQNNLDEPSA